MERRDGAPGYAPVDQPTVVVSRRAGVPEQLRGGAPEPGPALARLRKRGHLAEARSLLGGDCVLTLGDDEVDLVALKSALRDPTATQLLAEGSPTCCATWSRLGPTDELCATAVPRSGSPGAPRITSPPVDVPPGLLALLETDGTCWPSWTIST